MTDAVEVQCNGVCKNEEAIKEFLVPSEACKNCLNIAIQNNIHFFFFIKAKFERYLMLNLWPGIDVKFFFLLLFLI